MVRARPGAELLQKCEEPLRPDQSKPLHYNLEAIQDTAQKFRECAARQAKLVDWFKD